MGSPGTSRCPPLCYMHDEIEKAWDDAASMLKDEEVHAVEGRDRDIDRPLLTKANCAWPILRTATGR
jgi:hypothetical protein